MATPLDLALSERDRKLHIVAVGAHPDDPECGCGGTLARLRAVGHKVTLLYLTRGQAGIKGKSNHEAAHIRTQEAHAAAKILRADVVFGDQIDGRTHVTPEAINKFSRLLFSLRPDIVFTHWQLDHHPNHEMTSILTTQAWLRLNQKFTLYYYAVCSATAVQSMAFDPTEAIDITKFQDQKRQALLCHESQNPEAIYSTEQTYIEAVFGKKIGVQAAEAFALAKVETARTPGYKQLSLDKVGA